jgi:hypothetical protein
MVVVAKEKVRNIFKEFISLPWKQCEAVATHSGEINTPPQNCVLFNSNATCHGHDPG